MEVSNKSVVLEKSIVVNKVGIFFTPEDVATIVNISKDKLVEIVGIDTLLTQKGDAHYGRCPECGETVLHLTGDDGKPYSPPCFSVTPKLVWCQYCNLKASNPIEYLLERGEPLPEALLFLAVKLGIIHPPSNYEKLHFY